jgi:hypothetical protein
LVENLGYGGKGLYHEAMVWGSIQKQGISASLLALFRTLLNY